jgi:hypothetical protein
MAFARPGRSGHRPPADRYCRCYRNPRPRASAIRRDPLHDIPTELPCVGQADHLAIVAQQNEIERAIVIDVGRNDGQKAAMRSGTRAILPQPLVGEYVQPAILVDQRDVGRHRRRCPRWQSPYQAVDARERMNHGESLVAVIAQHDRLAIVRPEHDIQIAIQIDIESPSPGVRSVQDVRRQVRARVMSVK